MKSLLMGLLLVAGTSASAANVEITSFTYTHMNSTVAELCGKVTGSTKQIENVKVTVDYKSKRPGVYNVIAGDEGSFCTVVITYTGIAQASVRDGVELVSAKAEEAR